MLKNNFIALSLTLVVALAWLRINDFLAHKGLISSRTSRKIIHIGTGPIFVLCWLLFNSSPFSSIFAAVVPMGITLQFALVGFGLIKDPSAVEAMSRTGDRKEILRGPLFYGVVFVLLTILFWRNSPIGIIALMILCGGDGLADIVGNRIGRRNLPWSKRKTIAGSVTMLLGGFLFSALMIWAFVWQGYLVGPMSLYLIPIGLISTVAMFIESLPFENIDNITVPLVSVLIGLMFF